MSDLTDKVDLTDDKTMVLALGLALLEALGFRDVQPDLEVDATVAADNIFIVDFDIDEIRDNVLIDIGVLGNVTTADSFVDEDDLTDDLLILEVGAATHAMMKMVRKTNGREIESA